MQRVALLTGKNINLDKDYSKILESFMNKSGVISGLSVENGKVNSGQARVEVERSNGEKFFVLFDLTEDLTIDTSGDKKIYIEINQENIDDGEMNEENGEGIGEIRTGDNRPDKNFLKLARVEAGAIISEKEKIKINGDLLQTQNLKGSPNSLIRFDSNGNGEAIPEGQQGESLVIGPDGKAKFGIAKVEMPYLSAKRELGEDFDCEEIVINKENPYFTNYTTSGRTVSVSSEKTGNEAWKGIDNNYGTYWLPDPGESGPHFIMIQCPFKFVMREIGVSSVNGNSNLASFILQGSDDGVTRTEIKKGVNGNIGNGRRYEVENKGGFNYYRLYSVVSDGIQNITMKGYDVDNKEIVYHPKCYFIGTGTETYIESQHNGRVIYIGRSGQTSASLYGAMAGQPYCLSVKINVRKIGNPTTTPSYGFESDGGYSGLVANTPLVEGDNIIFLNGKTNIYFRTMEGLYNANNYWQVDMGEYVLAGEYTIGTEMGKKYISNLNFHKKTHRIDGIQFVSGKRGDKVIGIEGGIYELPIDYPNYNGILYSDNKGDVSYNIPSFDNYYILGEGLGKYINVKTAQRLTVGDMVPGDSIILDGPVNKITYGNNQQSRETAREYTVNMNARNIGLKLFIAQCGVFQQTATVYWQVKVNNSTITNRNMPYNGSDILNKVVNVNNLRNGDVIKIETRGVNNNHIYTNGIKLSCDQAGQDFYF